MQLQQKTRSLDQLVGEQLDRVRYLDAERPSRLQVDDELEFGRLQDRQVGRLRAVERRISCGAASSPSERAIT
jgi:hypothetical protein